MFCFFSILENMSSVAFEAETWSELGIGFVVVFLRVWARWKTVGVRNFRLDDYLVVLVLVSLRDFQSGDIMTYGILGVLGCYLLDRCGS